MGNQRKDEFIQLCEALENKDTLMIQKLVDRLGIKEKSDPSIILEEAIKLAELKLGERDNAKDL